MADFFANKTIPAYKYKHTDNKDDNIHKLRNTKNSWIDKQLK